MSNGRFTFMSPFGRSFHALFYFGVDMTDYDNIETKDDLAVMLGFKNSRYLNYLLYKIGVDNLYHTFSIQKKSGGERIISAPSRELKIVQRRLANILWNRYIEILEAKSKSKNVKIPSISHGFEKTKSIITNAQRHRNKKYIINVDLENYFDCFNFGRVRGFFIKDRDFKVSPDVATVIAQIACYQGKLPQGAPSSPIITNLIARILDYRIVRLAKTYRFTYTRYADDLTFSTNRNLLSNKLRAKKEFDKFLVDLEKIITDSGFKINLSKTRISNSHQRQEVTGIVVNKKINVKRDYFKNTKAMAYKLYKDGEFEIDGKLGTLEQLNGRFSFIFQATQYNNYLLYKKSLIDNNLEHQKNLLGQGTSKKSESKYYWKYIFYNRDLRRESSYNEKHRTYNLPEEFYTVSKEEKKNYMALFDSKEKEYKKFLFYKYFYGNNKPTLVTEGKTDLRYIKAALKKLYLQYPELIEKVDNRFVFKIDFFKHSNIIEYLFNVPEGGSGFMFLYNYFSNKKNFQMSNEEKTLYPNYIDFFRNFTSKKANKPTIFLFDNEPSGNPLYQFANYAKDLQIDTNNLNNVRGPSFGRISKKESLYIMATPLVSNQNNGNSSDVEDLLISTNKLSIQTFFSIKKINYNRLKDVKKHKEIFSKYVFKNYEQFDFTEYIPLLDGIRDNISNYKTKNK